MIVQAGEIKKMIDAAQQVVFGNVVFEIERVEKLSLILLIRPIMRKYSQYLHNQRVGILHLNIIRVFQQYFPESDRSNPPNSFAQILFGWIRAPEHQNKIFEPKKTLSWLHKGYIGGSE